MSPYPRYLERSDLHPEILADVRSDVCVLKVYSDGKYVEERRDAMSANSEHWYVNGDMKHGVQHFWWRRGVDHRSPHVVFFWRVGDVYHLVYEHVTSIEPLDHASILHEVESCMKYDPSED